MNFCVSRLILTLAFVATALLGAVDSTNARAATGCDPSLPPAEGCASIVDEGMLTLIDEMGQQVLAYCEANKVVAIFAVIDGKTVATRPSTGTWCSLTSLADYEPVINIDPRQGGWVIAYLGEDDNATMTAYACTETGITFVLKDPEYPVRVYERSGTCDPGAIPG